MNASDTGPIGKWDFADAIAGKPTYLDASFAMTDTFAWLVSEKVFCKGLHEVRLLEAVSKELNYRACRKGSGDISRKARLAKQALVAIDELRREGVLVQRPTSEEMKCPDGDGEIRGAVNVKLYHSDIVVLANDVALMKSLHVSTKTYKNGFALLVLKVSNNGEIHRFEPFPCTCNHQRIVAKQSDDWIGRLANTFEEGVELAEQIIKNKCCFYSQSK